MKKQCCVCNAIQDEDGSWVRHDRKDFSASHGFCPECKNSFMTEIGKGKTLAEKARNAKRSKSSEKKVIVKSEDEEQAEVYTIDHVEKRFKAAETSEEKLAVGMKLFDEMAELKGRKSTRAMVEMLEYGTSALSRKLYTQPGSISNLT